MSELWEQTHYLSLTLWDIDLSFQKASETYERWLSRNRIKSVRWGCFVGASQDDRLAKALRLGRRVQNVLEKGLAVLGARFERGDSTCNAILAAQLLRIQHEIYVPLMDSATSRSPLSIPADDILTTAKSVRRSCLHALRDQYARLLSPKMAPSLPPPRFSVEFCPFALQLQKDSTPFQTKKVRPQDRHDEREICPYCYAEVSVSLHTGLPNYRHLLFQSHLAISSSTSRSARATFACTSCYKTFDDSYAFLDHVYHKEIGSEKSCQRRWSSHLQLCWMAVGSEPQLVDKCLKNCIRRETIRAKTLTRSKSAYT